MAGQSDSSKHPALRWGVGPPLLGAGGALFIFTQIVDWLPLGFLGSAVNAVVWPVIIFAVLLGGFLTWRRFSGDS